MVLVRHWAWQCVFHISQLRCRLIGDAAGVAIHQKSVFPWAIPNWGLRLSTPSSSLNSRCGTDRSVMVAIETYATACFPNRLELGRKLREYNPNLEYTFQWECWLASSSNGDDCRQAN